MNLVSVWADPYIKCTSCGRRFLTLEHDPTCAGCFADGFVLDFETLEEAWMKHTLPQLKARFDQPGRPDYKNRKRFWRKWLGELLEQNKISHHQYNDFPLPKVCQHPRHGN